MPQMHLPIFPEGVEHITKELAVQQRDGRVTYFNGHMPLFSHDEKDYASFWMITSQFCAQGNCKQVDIGRVFGVKSVTMKRKVKLYREKGPQGFYRPKGKRGAPVLTPSVLLRAQDALNEGKSPTDVSRELGVKYDTLRKAIKEGRLSRLTAEEEKKDLSMRSER